MCHLGVIYLYVFCETHVLMKMQLIKKLISNTAINTIIANEHTNTTEVDRIQGRHDEYCVSWWSVYKVPVQIKVAFYLVWPTYKCWHATLKVWLIKTNTYKIWPQKYNFLRQILFIRNLSFYEHWFLRRSGTFC